VKSADKEASPTAFTETLAKPVIEAEIVEKIFTGPVRAVTSTPDTVPTLTLFKPAV
jgi:hypothetical protein